MLSNGDVVFLYGEIGVGKTTFIRGLINNIEIQRGMNKSEILSPTFNILFDYSINELKIMHYDLYRLKNDRDIRELGIFEEINNCITLIEWPELIKPKPKNRNDILFKYSKLIKSRKVNIVGFGKWKEYKFNEI